MEIVKRFLDDLNITYNKKTLTTFLITHPHHPSLLSFSDLLDEFNIENAAIKIEKANFIKIPTPFIAKTQSSEGDYCLVNKINNGNISYLNEKDRWQTIPLDKFLLQYNGVVLVAEKNIASGEPDYEQKRKSYRLRKTALVVSLSLILIILLSWFLYQGKGMLLLQPMLLLVIKVVGICGSVLLLMESFQVNNPFVNKLCSSASGNGCKNILTSDAAKILGGRSSWSEVGFFYFASTFLALCFFAGNNNMLSLLALLNLVSLPYTFYSVFYQFKIAKVWCKICLTMQLLLWLEFSTNIFYIKNGIVLSSLYFPIFEFLSLLVALVATWIIAKPLIISSLSISKLQRDINQFKKDEDIFYTLLKNQPEVESIDKRFQLIVGNPDANFEITFISNPYCQPCAEMHKKIKPLLNSERNDLRINFIYTPSPNQNDPKNIIIRQMIAIFLTKGSKVLENAMQEWYTSGFYDSKEWLENYRIQNIDEKKIDDILEGHRSWCKENDISHTPSLYINNHKYLSEYTFIDLKYFINSAVRSKYDKAVQMV